MSPMALAGSAGGCVPPKSPSPGSEGRVSDLSQSEEDVAYEEDEDFVQDDDGDDAGVEGGDSFENAVDEAITHSRETCGQRPASAKGAGGGSVVGGGPI